MSPIIVLGSILWDHEVKFSQQQEIRIVSLS